LRAHYAVGSCTVPNHFVSHYRREKGERGRECASRGAPKLFVSFQCTCSAWLHFLSAKNVRPPHRNSDFIVLAGFCLSVKLALLYSSTPPPKPKWICGTLAFENGIRYACAQTLGSHTPHNRWTTLLSLPQTLAQRCPCKLCEARSV